jgi:hypothetical protein
MFLVVGFRSTTEVLATSLMLCRHCHNPAANHVALERKRFALFFIPLFTVQQKYVLTCTFCGVTSELPPAEAGRLVGISRRETTRADSADRA